MRGTDLRDTGDAPDVDPQFQRVGANGRARPLPILELLLNLLP
jgi:hypothetical protein